MRPVLARRQERAFERVYQRHVGDVYRYALVVLSDEEGAEDVTHTTFRNAYQGCRDGRAPELNGLLSIAHDVCRRRGGYPRLDDSFLVEDVAEPSAADVRRALGRLPLDERAVLVLREVERRSLAEIARVLERPVEGVEQLIFDGRRHLRRELAGSMTCRQAELAVSRELDGALGRRERRHLRLHLDSCEDCAAFARGQQGQRTALRALAAVPLPSSLETFSAERKFRPARASS
jgi:DNA-directed RNA polymerase specialized sigma24 family protein